TSLPVHTHRSHDARKGSIAQSHGGGTREPNEPRVTVPVGVAQSLYIGIERGCVEIDQIRRSDVLEPHDARYHEWRDFLAYGPNTRICPVDGDRFACRAELSREQI